METKSIESICNEQVYAGVYRKLSQPILNMMYYKYGDIVQAEEVVQDAFIKLWENCSSVPIEKAKAFVYKVANNFSLNKIKHQKVVLKYQKEHIKSSKSSDNPQFILEEKEFKHRLELAINNLKEKERSTFLLHRIDGKTYQQIADLEGVSLKAIEKRMSNALSALRKHIDGI
ncbi:MAG: sigma-70 family RNA polymerase sigma factor [Flavobacteriaceae bacterium]|nr:sigma-70 family RNA polymerase sigma factor [Flavobacteriaceae bacterium]